MSDAKQVKVPQGLMVKVLWKMPPERFGNSWCARWKPVDLPASVAYICVKDGLCEWMAPNPDAKAGEHYLLTGGSEIAPAPVSKLNPDDVVAALKDWQRRNGPINPV